MHGLVEEMKRRIDDVPAAEAPANFLIIHGLQKYTRLRYEEERSQLPAWAERQGEKKILAYQREHNLSIDGLPGMVCREG